jgi:hypothetical protein
MIFELGEGIQGLTTEYILRDSGTAVVALLRIAALLTRRSPLRSLRAVCFSHVALPWTASVAWLVRHLHVRLHIRQAHGRGWVPMIEPCFGGVRLQPFIRTGGSCHVKDRLMSQWS